MRRINQPTLILAPTTAIRDRWVDRLVQHFLPGESLEPEWVSTSIRKPALLTVSTYQALRALCSGEMEAAEDQPAEEENGPVADGRNSNGHEADKAAAQIELPGATGLDPGTWESTPISYGIASNPAGPIRFGSAGVGILPPRKTLSASRIPARRAAGVQPMEAPRHDESVGLRSQIRTGDSRADWQRGNFALFFRLSYHRVEVREHLIHAHGVDLALRIVAFLDKLLQVAACDLRGELVGNHLA